MPPQRPPRSRSSRADRLSVALAFALTGFGACAETGARSRAGWNAEERDLDRACRQGATTSCGKLGRTLIGKSDNHKDVERGLVILELACGANELSSCAALGTYYALDDRPRSTARAFELLTRACQGGNAEACTAAGELGRRHPTVARPEDPNASETLRLGCAMGDARGCELFGVAEWNNGFSGDKAAAAQALAKGCALGRPSACHALGTRQLAMDDPAKKREGFALLAATCERGHPPSCAIAAIQVAPLVSPQPRCDVAAPLAARGCDAGNDETCAIVNACVLRQNANAADALGRLELLCDHREPLACLYWADHQSGAARAGADPERIHAAYDSACRGHAATSEIACPRFAAGELARAKTPADAETPLSFLVRACNRASPEACCALAEQYDKGAWVDRDPAKTVDLRAKACAGGVERCCP